MLEIIGAILFSKAVRIVLSIAVFANVVVCQNLGEEEVGKRKKGREGRKKGKKVKESKPDTR